MDSIVNFISYSNTLIYPVIAIALLMSLWAVVLDHIIFSTFDLKGKEINDLLFFLLITFLFKLLPMLYVTLLVFSHLNKTWRIL